VRSWVRRGGTLLFGAVCFALGAVFQPTLGAVGDQLRAWLVPGSDAPSLWFESIREDDSGNQLFFVTNSGQRHSVVESVHFCPPHEWYAGTLSSESSLLSWEPEHRWQLFQIYWRSGEWRIYCRVHAQVLRVLSGGRGVPPNGSTELITEAPAGWFLKSGVDRHSYTAQGECGLTLYADNTFVSQSVPCDHK
jgi:hypothetical protein